MATKQEIIDSIRGLLNQLEGKGRRTKRAATVSSPVASEPLLREHLIIGSRRRLYIGPKFINKLKVHPNDDIFVRYTDEGVVLGATPKVGNKSLTVEKDGCVRLTLHGYSAVFEVTYDDKQSLVVVKGCNYE